MPDVLGRKILGLLGLALTFLKPVFTAVIVMLLIERNTHAAATGIFLLMVADIFDGVLVRCSSYAANDFIKKLRRMADSTGDVVAIHSVLVVMAFSYNFPVILYAIPTVRHLLLAALLIYARTGQRSIWHANMPSRFAGLATGLVAIAWLLGAPSAAYVSAGLIILFGVIGFVQHYQKIRTGVD